MKHLQHQSACPSHYNSEAELYDAFNEKNSETINRLIETIFKKHKIKTVLDLTCGTGSQVFWLTKKGFEVTGSDINSHMLKKAKVKAKAESLDLKFLKRDMRTALLGKFDAVITIFNAIGHLTQSDFEKALQNIHANLKQGGLYVFDINNLSYLIHGNRITELTIDWQTEKKGSKNRLIQYSTIDNEGILTSYTLAHEQKGSGKPKITRSEQTLQIYTAKQLREILQRNGFKVLSQCGIDGSKLVETKTDRIVTIAKKIPLS